MCALASSVAESRCILPAGLLNEAVALCTMEALFLLAAGCGDSPDSTLCTSAYKRGERGTFPPLLLLLPSLLAQPKRCFRDRLHHSHSTMY